MSELAWQQLKRDTNLHDFAENLPQKKGENK